MKPGLYRNLDHYARLLNTACGRMRAKLLSLRGARTAAAVYVGPRCSFLRPWTLSLGTHSLLEADVFIKVVSDEAAIAIGEHAVIGRGVEFDIVNKLTVGNRVLITPGVFITDHSHGIDLGKPIQGQPSSAIAPVTIHHDAWIGANAVILPGVTIGVGAVIGAGSIVTRNVPPNTVVAGVPARHLRDRV